MQLGFLFIFGSKDQLRLLIFQTFIDVFFGSFLYFLTLSVKQMCLKSLNRLILSSGDKLVQSYTSVNLQ